MARATTVVLSALLLGASAPACSYPTHLVAGSLTALVSEPAPVPRKAAHPYRADARLAVLWVGHATALIQIDDRVILTDPVFTSTVGLLSKRLVAPGLDPEALPPLSAVLISHMHFDHLSLGSLERIEAKTRVALVPRGGLVYVPDFAFDTVEVAPWQTWEDRGMRMTAVPVEHTGDRYRIDGAWMTTSRTAWVVQYHGITVYFGGDTAYERDLFVRARARFPRIDVALLPIAPIHPRPQKRLHHTDPGEAVQAFLDLGARWMIPIHYDTFVNSTDAFGEPARVLRRVIAERRLPRGSAHILEHGEQRVLIPRVTTRSSRPQDDSATRPGGPRSPRGPAD